MASASEATSTVEVGTMVSSAAPGSRPASSSAVCTAASSAGALVTVQWSPSSARSSAPASITTSSTRSSSKVRGTVITPLRSNCQLTAPGSAIDPPFLLKTLRTSAPVRLRLSDRHSTITATPSGAYPS